MALSRTCQPGTQQGTIMLRHGTARHGMAQGVIVAAKGFSTVKPCEWQLRVHQHSVGNRLQLGDFGCLSATACHPPTLCTNQHAASGDSLTSSAGMAFVTQREGSMRRMSRCVRPEDQSCEVETTIM